MDNTVQTNGSSKLLTPQQYEAIELLAQKSTERITKGEIAERIGISSRTLQRWQRDASFQAEYKEAVLRASASRMPEVLAAMADAAIQQHNAAAARLIMQANGYLTQKVEVSDGQSSGSINVADLQRRLDRIRNEAPDIR